jgi:ribosomal protein S18 acetylase RimI-like enzyme
MTAPQPRVAAFPGGTTARRPTEADQPRIAGLVDQWFGGRRVWPLVTQGWFRHFASTSLLLEGPDGTLRAFLIGYVSPDRPAEAVIHLLAVDPNRRRLGIGRALVEAFAADVAVRGAATVRAVAWPDDPMAVSFFRAAGFRADDGPGSQNLYGVPAFPDFEFPGEDRAVFVRGLVGPG